MKTRSTLSCQVRPLHACLTGLLLAACSGSESEIIPDLVTDPDVLDEPIMVSEPIFEDGVATQNFEMLEDGVLRARFHDSDSDDGAGSRATIRSLPANGLLTLQTDGQVFVYTPEADYFGNDGFAYETHDGDSIVVNLQIAAVNDAPVLSSEFPRVAAQGSVFDYQLEASDVDDEELRYSASGLPGWLSLDSASGLLSGLPTQSDIGSTEPMSFRVSDSDGLQDEVNDITIEVIDVNDAPILNLTRLPSQMLARETVSARLFPDDPDGDAVVLDVEENAFILGSAVGGSVTLTASDVNEVTEVNLVIVATDQRGSVTREVVPITIFPLTESGRGITLRGVKEGRAVHVVVLGDGYTEDQQSLFEEHVLEAVDNIESDPGIALHMDALSIHMISTVSNDSGADDNETTDARDTYYDSTYSCGSIQRLICANALTMLTTAIEEYPDFDQVILLVNDLRYGGSGNSGARYAITSAYAPEIALHEMGHSLANLADEYVDNLLVETTGFPAFVEGNHPNVTALTDPEAVPWAHWIDPAESLPGEQGDAGVGLFEGGMYRSHGVYRPTFDSRMRSFDADFGPVNSEIWVLSLYEGTDGGIRGFSPSEQSLITIAGEPVSFIVSPIFDADVQSVQWFVDEVPVETAEDPDELVVTPEVGEHTVSVRVEDISGVIKRPEPHAGIFTREWVLEVQ